MRGNIIIVRICGKKCLDEPHLLFVRKQSELSQKGSKIVPLTSPAEGSEETPVGRLLLGYNVLRDDSVTQAGQL